MMKRFDEYTGHSIGWKLLQSKFLDLYLGELTHSAEEVTQKHNLTSQRRQSLMLKMLINDASSGLPSSVYQVNFKDRACRPIKYQDDLGKLKFTGICFPVQVTSLKKFENPYKQICLNEITGLRAQEFTTRPQIQKVP